MSIIWVSLMKIANSGIGRKVIGSTCLVTKSYKIQAIDLLSFKTEAAKKWQKIFITMYLYGVLQ